MRARTGDAAVGDAWDRGSDEQHALRAAVALGLTRALLCDVIVANPAWDYVLRSGYKPRDHHCLRGIWDRPRDNVPGWPLDAWRQRHSSRQDDTTAAANGAARTLSGPSDCARNPRTADDPDHALLQEPGWPSPTPR